MYSFYFRFFLSFFALSGVSVLVHYLGASPWGGALVSMPSRFLPEALLVQGLIWIVLSLLFQLLERGLVGSFKQRARHLISDAIRCIALLAASMLSIFSLIDREVMRWLGQHMSLSYILNFAGARDGQLFSRILSSDLLFSSLALLQVCLCLATCFWLLKNRQKEGMCPNKRITISFFLLLVTSALFLFSFRPSDKRWRRVRPAAVGIVTEVLRDRLGGQGPENPVQAFNDVYQLAQSGQLLKKGQRLFATQDQALRYPLLHRTSSVAAPQAVVLQDIIVIVFETMRGQNTGFLDSSSEVFGAMPLLKERLVTGSAFFPRVHSAGYPSVEGAMGMHLGIWPHPQKILFSTFLHGNTRGFPEIFRANGYESIALLGADPSFSNFTPWFRRWYDEVEYDSDRHHDGPLVERFIELHHQRVSSKKPLLMTLWTATTHPPYDVPESTGVAIADTNEERYLQAMNYTDRQLDKLLSYLQSSPRAARTKIVMLGDHSQPTPWQWQQSDKIGELTPGHTWTSLAILGQGLQAIQGQHNQSVSHIDLAPTLLDLAHIKADHHFFGHSLLQEAPERPVVSFRNGIMSVEEGNHRAIFHYRGGPVVSYSFDPSSPSSYGALEAGFTGPVTKPIDVERYRDMAKAWAILVEEDRVFPASLLKAKDK